MYKEVGAIKELLPKHKIQFLGLVEIKSANVSENWIRRIWGRFDFD